MEPQDNSVYVISLDAVDLNLLPTIYNTRDDSISPLWTRSNLERRNNEYYKFEIRSQNSEKSVKDQKPKLDFENIICHICDIEVPKPFFSEHCESARHQTNLKIADVAIHRMRQYINNIDIGNSNTDCDHIDLSIYFCAICAAVFESKDKSTHEKSLAHKNGLILEKIFSDFINFYHCNDKGNDVKANDDVKNLNGINVAVHNQNSIKSTTESIESIEKSIKPKHNGVLKDASTEKKKLDGLNVTTHNQNSIQSTNNKIQPIETSIKPKHNGVPKDASSTEKENEILPLSLNDYLASLKKHMGHSMFFKVHNDNNLIEIETIDGSIVKICEENFHSFNRIGKRLIQCLVCKEIFKKKKLDEHKMCEKHIKYMIAPLKDKHCARQIDNNSSHCLICNKITESSALHELCDKDHESKLQEALISDRLIEENCTNSSQPSTWKDLCLNKSNYTDLDDNCEEKEMEVCDSKQKDMVTNNIGHIKIESDQAKQYINNISQEQSEGSQGFNTKEYFCTHCNEYMFRVAEHKITEKHILNSKSEYHYMMRETENKLTCKVCQSTITNNIEHVHMHVLEKEHIEKHKQLLEENRIIKVMKGILYCEFCQEVVLIKNELIHINTKSHQVKCLITEHDNEKNKDKTFIEYFRCEICNVKVPNNDSNIQEHLNGRSHSSKVGTITNRTSVEKTEKQNEITNIHYQMESSKYTNILNCRVCNVNVLHNELSISVHLSHPQHTTNYTKLLKDNYMAFRPDNNCYCNICDVCVGINNEIMHAFGKKHKKTLLKQLSTTKLPVTGVNIYLPTVSTDNPSISNIKEIKEKVKLSYADVSNKPTLSKLNSGMDTNVLVPKNINSTSMSVGENLVLVDNPDIEPEMLALLIPTQHPKNVICRICNVALPYNQHNVSTHMNGLKHSLQISLTTQKVKNCTV